MKKRWIISALILFSLCSASVAFAAIETTTAPEPFSSILFLAGGGALVVADKIRKSKKSKINS